nr:protein kinase 4-like [Nicotiana tomentosiformis]
MVTSWILNSLTKEIADSVEYVTDAFELWRELEDRYDQTNGTKLYQIQKEINDLSQGALDITGYYIKMKKLWEELNTLIVKSHCTYNCTCGAKESMHKAEQDKRLIQFLMGLNETYTIVRGSILMMNHLPSIAQTFSLLIQEERQRKIKPNNHLALESSALSASTNRPGSFKTNYSPNNNHNNMNRPFCDYCKRPGHTKEKCYKLHEYLQSFSQNQNPNTNHNQTSNFNQNPRQSFNYNHNSNNN